MLLPTKHIIAENSILGVGADLLRLIEHPKAVAVLFRDLQELRQNDGLNAIQFDWFLLALDFLFLIGLIRYDAGTILRAQE